MLLIIYVGVVLLVLDWRFGVVFLLLFLFLRLL